MASVEPGVKLFGFCDGLESDAGLGLRERPNACDPRLRERRCAGDATSTSKPCSSHVGRHSGAREGGVEGSFRWSRIAWTVAEPVTVAITRMRFAQRGQRKTSRPHVRFMSMAHPRWGLRPQTPAQGCST